MDSALVNHFINGLYDTCESMLGFKPALAGKPFLRQHDSPGREISGVIGLSGRMQCTMALCFERPVAERIAQRFLAASETPPFEDVLDSIAELVNIVAGAAKGSMTESGVSLSLPEIVIGASRIHHPGKAACIAIPFETEWGPFTIELTVRS